MMKFHQSVETGLLQESLKIGIATGHTDYVVHLQGYVRHHLQGHGLQLFKYCLKGSQNTADHIDVHLIRGSG